jgi:hypothetical protein
VRCEHSRRRNGRPGRCIGGPGGDRQSLPLTAARCASRAATIILAVLPASAGAQSLMTDYVDNPEAPSTARAPRG